jgi:uncharacterized damage-inducible protein DinB
MPRSAGLCRPDDGLYAQRCGRVGRLTCAKAIGDFMSQPAHTVPASLADSLGQADAALARLDDALAQLGDGDLHRAHSDGGWTVAQVISHIALSATLWLGTIKRLENDAELDYLFREELGHDAVGYPPPSIELARRQIASTRRALATAGPAVSSDVLARVVEMRDGGTAKKSRPRTIEQWVAVIMGHEVGHVEQAFEIMRNRSFGPGQP